MGNILCEKLKYKTSIPPLQLFKIGIKDKYWNGK